MTVNGEVATHPNSVVKLSPLKKSASFTISVDKVEVSFAKKNCTLQFAIVLQRWCFPIKGASSYLHLFFGIPCTYDFHLYTQVKPTRIYTKPLDDVGEEWSGDEEDTVDEVIIPGTDWESVNYVYKKFPAEVSSPIILSTQKFLSLSIITQFFFLIFKFQLHIDYFSNTFFMKKTPLTLNCAG